MSYTSKYTGEEIDELLSQIQSTNDGSTITTLFEGAAGVGDITFTESLENYDLLYIESSCTDAGNDKCERDTRIIDVSTIEYLKDGNIYTNTYNLASVHGNGTNGGYYRIYFGFKNNTTLNVIAAEKSGWTNPVINKVKGIKLANGIIGAGSNVSQTVLWEGTLSTTNQVVDLSDSLENYDYIGVAWKYTSSSYSRIMPISWLDVQSIKDGKYASSVMFPTTAFVNVRDSMSRQVMYSFPSATQLKYNDAMAPTSDSSVTKTITRVIGIKIALLSGTSSYGETELLDAPITLPVKNSATILNQEFTINNDIANYDELVFELAFLRSSDGLATVTGEHRMLVSNIRYSTVDTYTEAFNQGGALHPSVIWNGATSATCGTICVYFKNGNTMVVGFTTLNNSNYNKVQIRSIKGIKR